MIRKVCLLLGACAICAFLYNCSKHIESVTEKSAFRITPPVFDFGRVRESEGVVPVEFVVENTSTEPLEILDVVSGCGCTVIDLASQKILPHEKLSVTGRVDVSGRLGGFSNQIIIRTEKGLGKFDIQGVVIRDLWTNGQTVRVSATNSSQPIQTTFEVYTTDFPDVVFETIEPNELFSVEEISRVTESGTTTIRFSLTVALPKESFSSEIILVPTTKEIKQLAIPVQCYASDH